MFLLRIEIVHIRDEYLNLIDKQHFLKENKTQHAKNPKLHENNISKTIIDN